MIATSAITAPVIIIHPIGPPPEGLTTNDIGSPVSARTVAVGIGITEVAVGVTVTVTTVVGVLVGVCVLVGVAVGVLGVAVAVGVLVGVAVCVGVAVGVEVFVGVGVSVIHADPDTGVPLQGSGTSVGVLGTFVPIGVGSGRSA